MNYPYHTTKIMTKRRYPTYQLHARTINESLPPMTVMGICILETMSWLRGRLAQYDTIPTELCMPEPDDYSKLDMQSLKSFHLNLGFSVDVVYSEKDKLWAFCLTESDMGANIGTPDERLPVPGRNFETNIAFRVVENNVEVGFQTICSEPSDTTKSCEVFRPALVKALFRNKNVGLRHILNITDKPIGITTAKEFQRVRGAVSNPMRELPVVIITQPQAVTKTPNVPKTKIGMSSLSDFVPQSGLHNVKADFSTRLGSDFGAFDVKLNKLENKGLKIESAPPKKQEFAAPNIPNTPNIPDTPVTPDTVDVEKFAKTAASFALVCQASDEMFENIRKAFCADLAKGDVLIIYKGAENDVFRFTKLSNNLTKARHEICEMLILYPMRRSIEWGNIVFASDARIMDYQNRRSEKLTVDEENALLKAETEELRQKLKNAEDHNRDINANAEEIRRQSKEIAALKQELEDKEAERVELIERADLMESAAKNMKPTVDFYKEKARAAARFPLDKADVSDWAEAEFSDTLLIHKNAVASLKKFPRTVDMEVLCDGLYFLHGYGLFRQGKISQETLDMYAEECSWEVQGCGKEALKMFRNEYSVQMEGGSKELSHHIKYGVNPSHLVRIYFYYDEDLSRVVIGYMPDHLPTISDRT